MAVFFGAVPVGNYSAGEFSGRLRKYVVPATDATAIYKNDFVKVVASPTADTTDPELIVVTRVSGNTDTPVGIVVSFEPQLTSLLINYRVASTRRVLLVADDPDILFLMPENGTGGSGTGGLLPTTANGQNVDYDASQTGSTVTGISALVLKSADNATTSSLPITLLGYAETSGNIVSQRSGGSSTPANPVWLCAFNQHYWRSSGKTAHA